MASPIILQFDDEPVIAKYDAKEDELNDELSKFKQKYSSLVPDIEERFFFETDDDELHFKLGEEGEYSSLDDEGSFILSFFESNLEISRPVNGFGKKLSEDFYKDLFKIMNSDGQVYWSNGGDSICINFIGDFDFESYCFVKDNGCFWEVD